MYTYIYIRERGSRQVNGLVEDCSDSIANALELLHSCTKPSVYNAFIIYRLALKLHTGAFINAYQVIAIHLIAR